jgi:beta-lactam-binding protein with PASTA domain
MFKTTTLKQRNFKKENSMTYKHWMLALVILAIALGTGCNKVPDLTGMTKDQAQAQLAKDKLQMGTVTFANQPGKPAGTVLDQDPKPKEKIPDNKIVALVLQSDGSTSSTGTTGGTTTGTTGSTGTGAAGTQGTQSPNTVAVPNLSGQTQNEAEAALNQIGLVPGNMNVVLNDKPAGKVFEQDPPAGTSVQLGTVVNLSISSDALVNVPPVMGQPQAIAEQMIRNAQLIPQSESDIHQGPDPVGNVFDQNPAQGLKIAKGQTVILKVKQEAAVVPHTVGMTLQQAQLALYQNNLTPVVHYVRDPGNILKVTAQTVADNTPLAKYSPVGITVGELDLRLIGRYVVMAQPQAAATQRVQVNKMVRLFR